MLVIGLTGGIGSGKSTVAAMLGERGAAVIDVDALGRVVIAPGGRAEAGVLEEFGSDIASPDGHIDRSALAAVVFGDAEALQRLTAISHPAINEELAERLDRLGASAAPPSVVVLDMAILVESNLGQGAYTRIVTVEAPLELRVERAVARGMAEDDVRRRIESQATEGQRRKVADAVVVNDGDLEALSIRVETLWSAIEGWYQG
ncbi:MAG TPA: dephospho-CoA kinase [Ilumatobacteraceae bacterium]|nr:dephospho-CoA kinase [Ilumatobacteraceae bacterium]